LAGVTCCSIDLQTGCWRGTQPGSDWVGRRRVRNLATQPARKSSLRVIVTANSDFSQTFLQACLKTAWSPRRQTFRFQRRWVKPQQLLRIAFVRAMLFQGVDSPPIFGRLWMTDFENEDWKHW